MEHHLTCSEISLMREDWVAERAGPQLSDWLKTGIYTSPTIYRKVRFRDRNMRLLYRHKSGMAGIKA